MTRTRKRLAVSAAGVAIAVALGAWAGAAVASPTGSTEVAADSLPTPSALQVNDSGMTYGSLAGYSDDEAPDLVLVALADDTEGYVLSADLFEAEGPQVETPEEAVALQSQQGPVTIPVYEADGRTVIGEFTVGGYDDIPAPSRDQG